MPTLQTCAFFYFLFSCFYDFSWTGLAGVHRVQVVTALRPLWPLETSWKYSSTGAGLVTWSTLGSARLAAPSHSQTPRQDCTTSAQHGRRRWTPKSQVSLLVSLSRFSFCIENILNAVKIWKHWPKYLEDFFKHCNVLWRAVSVAFNAVCAFQPWILGRIVPIKDTQWLFWEFLFWKKKGLIVESKCVLQHALCFIFLNSRARQQRLGPWKDIHYAEI